jgi:hypothetical protein
MINEINYSSGDDDVEYNLRSKYCVYSCNQRPEKVCFTGQCIVYVKNKNTNQWAERGKTECVNAEEDPIWLKPIITDYFFE